MTMQDLHYRIRLYLIRFYLATSDYLLSISDVFQAIAKWFRLKAAALTTKARREIDVIERCIHEPD